MYSFLSLSLFFVYSESMANMGQIPVLLQAKKDIEEKMEAEKWQRVADAIEE